MSGKQVRQLTQAKVLKEPYRYMQKQTIKKNKSQAYETIPSIRPAIVEKCNPKQTASNEALEDVASGRVFDKDILDIWKQIPEQHTLSFYGISSQKYQPEAIAFNQLVSTCLQRVNHRPKATRKPTKPENNLVHYHGKLAKTTAGGTLSCKYYVSSKKLKKLFTKDLSNKTSIKKKIKRDLRTKHKYCNNNQCRDIVWSKYTAYDKAFQRKMNNKQKIMETDAKKSLGDGDGDGSFVSKRVTAIVIGQPNTGDDPELQLSQNKSMIKSKSIFPMSSKPMAKGGGLKEKEDCIVCNSDLCVYFDCLSATSEIDQ